MFILLAIFGAWFAGAIVAWEIYDIEGPKTGNVSGAIIIWAFSYIGKIAGTIFWPFVLLFKIIDFFYDLFGEDNGLS